MEQEGKIIVRTASETSVGDNTGTGSTVVKSTANGPNDATVIDITVTKNILKELSSASQLESTELMENDMEVLRAVTIQQKTTRWKEEGKVLLKGNAFLITRNYKVMASIGIGGVWKMLTAIFETRAGPNLLKKNCLPRGLARIVVTMKATLLQSAANTQLEAKEVIRLKI